MDIAEGRVNSRPSEGCRPPTHMGHHNDHKKAAEDDTKAAEDHTKAAESMATANHLLVFHSEEG